VFEEIFLKMEINAGTTLKLNIAQNYCILIVPLLVNI